MAAMNTTFHAFCLAAPRSGEGKTTMLRLMLGLLHPQEGERILIGETDGEKIAVDPSARRLFSYVPQGNTMFSGTIAENMRNVRPEASDEEICEVLKAACAWEFVEKLPDGIYSMWRRILGGTGAASVDCQSTASPITDSSAG